MPTARTATINRSGLVRLIPTDDLPEDKKRPLPPSKEGQYGTEVKLHDKVKALELLGKHLGVFDSGSGPAANRKTTFLQVIDRAPEEIDTDDIPGIEPPAKSGHDLVNRPGFEDYDGIVYERDSIRSGKTTWP